MITVSQVYVYPKNLSNYIHKICPFFVYQGYLDKAVRKKKLWEIGLVYGTHFGKYGNTEKRPEISFFLFV